MPVLYQVKTPAGIFQKHVDHLRKRISINLLCFVLECVRLINWYQFTFFLHSKVWSMLRHGWVGRVHIKNDDTSWFCLLFWNMLFFIIKFAFFIFNSFFDKASNFRNRILTNQKQELVVQNCQSNSMVNSMTEKAGYKLPVKYQPSKGSLIKVSCQ